MLDFLYQLDISLFTLVNNFPHSPILDLFFSFLTGVGSWGVVWLVLAAALFIWEEIEYKKSFVVLVLAILTSLILVEFGLKNIIKRERPEFILPGAMVIGETVDSFSFPSGHATIAFAGAFVLAAHHKKWKWLYFLLASLISFSRVYLGQHYPSDVLAGALTGMLVGYYSFKITERMIGH